MAYDFCNILKPMKVLIKYASNLQSPKNPSYYSCEINRNCCRDPTNVLNEYLHFSVVGNNTN